MAPLTSSLAEEWVVAVANRVVVEAVAAIPVTAVGEPDQAEAAAAVAPAAVAAPAAAVGVPAAAVGVRWGAAARRLVPRRDPLVPFSQEAGRRVNPEIPVPEHPAHGHQL